MSKKRPTKAKKSRRRLIIPLAKPVTLTMNQSVLFYSVVDMMAVAAIRIADQIIAQVALTIQANGKQIAPGSFDRFQPGLVTSILNNLKSLAVWNAPTEAAVLGVAADMGKIAVILAGGSSQVAQSQLEAAYNAVARSHTSCGAASGGQGGGTWCNFEL